MDVSFGDMSERKAIPNLTVKGLIPLSFFKDVKLLCHKPYIPPLSAYTCETFV